MLGALNKIRKREVGVPRHHPELSFIDKADLELKDWQFGELTNQGRKALVILHYEDLLGLYLIDSLTQRMEIRRAHSHCIQIVTRQGG